MDVNEKITAENDTKNTQLLGVGIKRSAFNAAIVAQVAQLLGLSKRQVYYVLNGSRENQAVFNCYMTILEGNNQLIEEVKKLVPFD
jgi:hypothetical protein